MFTQRHAACVHTYRDSICMIEYSIIVDEYRHIHLRSLYNIQIFSNNCQLYSTPDNSPCNSLRNHTYSYSLSNCENQ